MVAGSKVLALTTVLVLGAASCSSGGDASSEPTRASPAGADGTPDCGAEAGLRPPLEDRGFGEATAGSVTLDASEFAFTPTCVRVEGGGALDVTVTNGGAALHNLQIESLDIDEDIDPGASISVQVELPVTGALPFICKYHTANGMQGAFLSG